MGLQQLPDELLLSMTEQWPCRDMQLRQLSYLLSPVLPSPSTVVAYGPSSTGRSSIISSYLRLSNISYAMVRCGECVTGRHLLERIVGSVYQTLQEESNGDAPKFTARCENLGTLAAHLQRALAGGQKFVLVLDGVDKQREAPPTLLPALARMGELIPSLTMVLITQHAPPRFLRQTGTPHIHFPSYTRNQSIHILSKQPLDIFPKPYSGDQDYDEETHEEDKAWLWPRFVAAVWDSLAQNSARDLVGFRDLCNKLWTPFVQPIVNGDFGTRDFSRLLVSQRRLFQDESVLLDSIVSHPTLESTIVSSSPGHTLPYYAKWLLVAGYLASFNPGRMDALFFMKSTEKKRRKKGGGTARSGGGRASQTRKTPRHLLAPSTFALDRMLSILHAILPHDLKSTIEVYTQIATLTSLRLLTRTGGIGSSDLMEPGGKMRVGAAVTWEYVQALARSLDFNLMDYIAE